MLAFSLLPLICYAAFQTWMHFRKNPTVLNGKTDFLLLAWGLFGLISFGPARLIIPLYLFTAWGIYTWFFWAGFYFAAAQILAPFFRNRLILYHCQKELVLPRLFTCAREMDTKTEWAGNVLSLHGLRIQWSVTCDPFGGHILFLPTDPYKWNPHQESVQKRFADLCQTLEMPQRNIRWFWALLTFGLCLIAGFSLLQII